MRILHIAYAKIFGYFWKPCPSCGSYFGGHQNSRTNHIDNIPTTSPYSGTMICPSCTGKGIGCVNWFIKEGVRHPKCGFLNDLPD